MSSAFLKNSPSQNAKLYHKINCIITKYHPCPYLRKKEKVLNVALVLFLEHALKHVFRTCKSVIFTLYLSLKKATCQGFQNIFLLDLIRANIGLSIFGEKSLGDCILFRQYCIKNGNFPKKT